MECSASTEEIREAYLYKVNILHPDRLGGMPEKIRIKAEQDLRQVNYAYSILADPDGRTRYDLQIRVTPNATPVDSPVPELHPSVILIEDGLPFVKQRRTFFVRNNGGPFNRVLISPAPEWLKVLEIRPVQQGHILPMQVDIEAVGTHWEETYLTMMSVYLDNIEALVTIELHMMKKPG